MVQVNGYDDDDDDYGGGEDEDCRADGGWGEQERTSKEKEVFEDCVVEWRWMVGLLFWERPCVNGRYEKQ